MKYRIWNNRLLFLYASNIFIEFLNFHIASILKLDIGFDTWNNI